MTARGTTAALAALLLASACGTNERRAREWAYANRGKTAAWCADLFPVRELETVRGRTVLIPGRPAVLSVDTVRLRARCPDGTEAECPPAAVGTVTVTDTLLRTDTLKLRDTAAERALAAQRDAIARERDAMAQKLEKAREERGKWRGGFLAAAAMAALLLWRLAARR